MSSSYSMHSVHYEIEEGTSSISFKAKEGYGKVKLVILGPSREHEMSFGEFDSFLG